MPSFYITGNHFYIYFLSFITLIVQNSTIENMSSTVNVEPYYGKNVLAKLSWLGMLLLMTRLYVESAGSYFFSINRLLKKCDPCLLFQMEEISVNGFNDLDPTRPMALAVLASCWVIMLGLLLVAYASLSGRA